MAGKWPDSGPFIFLTGLILKVKWANLGLYKNKWAWIQTYISAAPTPPMPTPNHNHSKSHKNLRQSTS